MIDDPTVVQGFAALGGASSVFVAFKVLQGITRFVKNYRSQASYDKIAQTAEAEDLKETLGKLTEAVERLKALAAPIEAASQAAPSVPAPQPLPWIGGRGEASNG